MSSKKTKQGYKLIKWYFGKEIQIPEEWEIKKLSDLSEKIKDIVAGPFGSNLVVSDYKSQGVPIIRLQNIDRNQFINKNIQFISNKKAEELNYHSYIPNDLVLAKLGDPIGKTCKIPKDFPEGIVVADVVRIRTSPKKSNQNFVEYVLNSKMCEKQHNMKKIGTTRPRVNLDQIRNLQFPTPSIPEQQKIASILSNVDALIESTQRIIYGTERLKKGLMQKLLTRGIGHDKFKKVKWNYGKLLEIPKTWDIVLLDTVAQRGSGHTPDIKKPEFYNGGIKWISLADSNRLDNIHISETTKEISQKGIENSSAVIHPSGVVVLSRDAGIGKSAITKTEMAVSQHFMVWQCGEHLNNYFLYYLLQFWKSLFESIAIGTTIPTIGLSFFKKFRIIFPQKIEQDKIANILSNVDSQIQSQTQYKEKLEKVKKSLMQKLLTGQVRVTV